MLKMSAEACEIKLGSSADLLTVFPRSLPLRVGSFITKLIFLRKLYSSVKILQGLPFPEAEFQPEITCFTCR
jgi:hypothetical protein